MTRMLLNTLPWQQKCVRLKPYKYCKGTFCIAAQHIDVRDIHIPFHLHVRFYPNSLTPFGSKTRIIWRFYVTLSGITYWGLHAKCSVFRPPLNKFGFYLHIFIIVFDNKSYENPSTIHTSGHNRTERHESYNVVLATTRRSPKSSQHFGRLYRVSKGVRIVSRVHASPHLFVCP